MVVLGPTASGKTRYAVELAREINAMVAVGMFEGCPGRMTDECPVSGAEIISADSRQDMYSAVLQSGYLQMNPFQWKQLLQLCPQE